MGMEMKFADIGAVERTIYRQRASMSSILITTPHPMRRRVHMCRRRCINFSHRILPVPHYRITPRKVPPDRQFTGKIRPARATAGRDGFLPINYRPRGDFSERGRSYNGETFYMAGDILISGRHINFVIISSWADFSWGNILM